MPLQPQDTFWNNWSIFLQTWSRPYYYSQRGQRCRAWIGGCWCGLTLTPLTRCYMSNSQLNSHFIEGNYLALWDCVVASKIASYLWTIFCVIFFMWSRFSTKICLIRLTSFKGVYDAELLVYGCNCCLPFFSWRKYLVF